MQEKNGSIGIVIAAVVVAILVAGGYFAYQYYSEPKLVGDDIDSHGCFVTAGFSWCEAKQKCLRTWEEACDTN